MWTKSTMSFSNSLMVSLFGLLIVFLILVSLCIAIIVVSKILKLITKQESKGEANLNSDQQDVDIEPMAIILAAVAEETGLTPEQFKITKITEI